MKKNVLIVIFLVGVSYVTGISSYKVDMGLESSMVLLNRTLILLSAAFFIYLVAITLDDYVQVAPMIYSRGVSKKGIDKIILLAMIKVILKFWILKFTLEMILGVQETWMSINFVVTITVMSYIMFLLIKKIKLSTVISLCMIFLVIDSNSNFNLWLSNVSLVVIIFKLVILGWMAITIKGVKDD